MIGYISNITKLKNEDIIVRIITNNNILNLYRFYGLRHSIINIGRKIDFEIDSNGIFMPRLRHISQIKFNWENDNNRLYYWQQFIKLINKHLSDIETLPSFYIEILDKGAIYINKQAPARVLLDLYVNILSFEGRLFLNNKCFICNLKLDNDIVITRGFLTAHKTCIPNSINTIAAKKFFHFLSNKKSIFLDDNNINYLLKIMLNGL